MSVYKKLMQARLTLQGTKIKETGNNKFAGYFYLTLGDFLPTVQRIFSDLGLCGIVSYTADVASLSIYDIDGGDPIVITSPMGSAALKGCHEVQNVGAVETYQRRYLWVTAMEIVEHDALDSTTGKNGMEVPDENAEFVAEHISEVKTLMEVDNIELAAKYLNRLGVSGTYDAEAKEIVWGALDSRTRSAIKACDAITQAVSLEALVSAWQATPKHSQTALLAVKDKRKLALQPQLEEAA